MVTLGLWGPFHTWPILAPFDMSKRYCFQVWWYNGTPISKIGDRANLRWWQKFSRRSMRSLRIFEAAVIINVETWRWENKHQMPTRKDSCTPHSSGRFLPDPSSLPVSFQKNGTPTNLYSSFLALAIIMICHDDSLEWKVQVVWVILP